MTRAHDPTIRNGTVHNAAQVLYLRIPLQLIHDCSLLGERYFGRSVAAIWKNVGNSCWIPEKYSTQRSAANRGFKLSSLGRPGQVSYWQILASSWLPENIGCTWSIAFWLHFQLSFHISSCKDVQTYIHTCGSMFLLQPGPIPVECWHVLCSALVGTMWWTTKWSYDNGSPQKISLTTE
jgi:hypothetical protein